MTWDEAEASFLRLIEARGLSLATLRPGDGIGLMLLFYREERAEGCCPIDEDGDMLVYQWGCYDWGEGESFELDITRQFLIGEGEDEGIYQLHLTFKFEPDDALRGVGSGNRWCRSPGELEDLRAFIEASAALRAAGLLRPSEVVLQLGGAG